MTSTAHMLSSADHLAPKTAISVKSADSSPLKGTQLPHHRLTSAALSRMQNGFQQFLLATIASTTATTIHQSTSPIHSVTMNSLAQLFIPLSGGAPVLNGQKQSQAPARKPHNRAKEQSNPLSDKKSPFA